MARASLRADLSAQAVSTGVTAALLGYASSVAVVVAGLVAVGASPAQVSTALLALGVAMAVGSVALSIWTRLPVSVVWSTPALALLTTLGPLDGGLPAVVGAFVVTGLLIALTGLVRPLMRALQRLPGPLTAAVLAGVLLPFCLAPAQALGGLPREAGAICLAWLFAIALAPRFAAPVALLALVAVVLATGSAVPDGGLVAPALDVLTPTLSLQALTAVVLPAYLVTMAAQNLVGLSVLSAQGYVPPTGRLLLVTGAGSAVLAPLGTPTLGLAAITGALTAGPGAHPDLERRWVAAAASGVTYLALGVLSPLTSALVAGADPRLVATAAGLGLLPAFLGAASTALELPRPRLAAGVTLLVTASGVTAAGLGPAVLGLLAGLLLLALTRTRG